MKNIIVANWKANKDIHEVSTWIRNARSTLEESSEEVVVCPDFVSIAIAASLLKGTSVKIGAQDISQFEKGPYTGEVTGNSLAELADYVLIGHSERREKFGENKRNKVMYCNYAWFFSENGKS